MRDKKKVRGDVPYTGLSMMAGGAAAGGVGHSIDKGIGIRRMAANKSIKSLREIRGAGAIYASLGLATGAGPAAGLGLGTAGAAHYGIGKQKKKLKALSGLSKSNKKLKGAAALLAAAGGITAIAQAASSRKKKRKREADGDASTFA